MKSFEQEYKLLPMIIGVLFEALHIGLGKGQFQYFERKFVFTLQVVNNKVVFSDGIERREIPFTFDSLQKISDFIVHDCLHHKEKLILAEHHYVFEPNLTN